MSTFHDFFDDKTFQDFTDTKNIHQSDRIQVIQQLFKEIFKNCNVNYFNRFH